jgi:hypothetical protein
MTNHTPRLTENARNTEHNGETKTAKITWVRPSQALALTTLVAPVSVNYNKADHTVPAGTAISVASVKMDPTEAAKSLAKVSFIGYPAIDMFSTFTIPYSAINTEREAARKTRTASTPKEARDLTAAEIAYNAAVALIMHSTTTRKNEAGRDVPVYDQMTFANYQVYAAALAAMTTEAANLINAAGATKESCKIAMRNLSRAINHGHKIYAALNETEPAATEAATTEEPTTEEPTTEEPTTEEPTTEEPTTEAA